MRSCFSSVDLNVCIVLFEFTKKASKLCQSSIFGFKSTFWLLPYAQNETYFQARGISLNIVDLVDFPLMDSIFFGYRNCRKYFANRNSLITARHISRSDIAQTCCWRIGFYMVPAYIYINILAFFDYIFFLNDPISRPGNKVECVYLSF